MPSRQSRHYTLTCLLCYYQHPSLVDMQEHAMDTHGYTQEDHRQTTRRDLPADAGAGYIYTFPDGTDWLLARESPEEP